MATLLFSARFRMPGFPLLLAVFCGIVGCEQVSVTTVDAARVEISPLSATIPVAQTTRLTATVFSSSGQTLNGRAVNWDSESESIALVDNTGLVRGLSPGTTTVRATSGGAVGSATITVSAAPELTLAPAEVSFSAVQSGSTPGDRTVAVTNAGAGTLTGLTSAIRYAAGGPTGWLTATLAGTSTPTTLILSANQGSLALGDYTATVDVTSASGTKSVSVRLSVITPGPSIALSSTSIAFTGIEGGADPAAQTVSVSNPGSGTVTGLSAPITYTTGEPTGWLNASFSSTTAPATLTLRPTTGSLTAGTYTAIVRVTSAAAQNSPQSISVTYTVGNPQPAIALDPPALNFVAMRTGGSPPAQTVNVTNAGSATLSGLTLALTYPGQQPTGWLTAELNTTTAPAVITVTATTGSLPSGTFNATISVSSALAGNSPQQVQVTFLVQDPLPTSPVNVTATPVSSTQINVSWGAATGVVTRYRIERRTGPVGGFVLVDSVTANVFSYQNTGLTPGTSYTYRMQACNATGCSLRSQEITATTAPAAATGLAASAVSPTQINLSWNAVPGTVDSHRVERSTTSGSGFTEIGIATPGAATTYQNTTGLAAATAYFYRMRSCNAGGCSAFTGQVTAITLPNAPTGLTATPASATQINLSWAAVSGTIASYRVERGAAAGGPFSEIASLANTVTTFQNTGLTTATDYFYRVRACLSNGACSAYSAVATAETQ